MKKFLAKIGIVALIALSLATPLSASEFTPQSCGNNLHQCDEFK